MIMAPPLEVYLLSFNCARNLIEPDSFAPTFFGGLPKDRPAPDLISVSLQELAPIAYSFLGGSHLDSYFDRVATTVDLATRIRFSDQSLTYQPIGAHNIGLTALIVFVKAELSNQISWVQKAATGVGVWEMGNKGAVGIRVGLSVEVGEEQALTFVSAHLAPFENDWERRNEDWENIVRTLVFADGSGVSNNQDDEEPLLSTTIESINDQSGIYTPGTQVFFSGDLNYRTSDVPPEVQSYLTYPQPSDLEDSSNHFRNLLSRDQLSREMQEGKTLHGFEEAPISFLPTYKYSFKRPASALDPASADVKYLPWAKHRQPSWCDRILFLPGTESKRISTNAYTSLPLPPTSDHQPVALSVTIEDSLTRTSSNDDMRRIPPFPIDSSWKSRRNAARRLEIIVGVLSYIGLTREGNVAMAALAGGVLGAWLILRTFNFV